MLPAVVVILACIIAAVFHEHEACEAMKLNSRRVLHLQQQLLHQAA